MILTKKQTDHIYLILRKNEDEDTTTFLNKILHKRQYNEDDAIQLNEIRHWYNWFYGHTIKGRMLLLTDTKKLMEADGYAYDAINYKFYKL